MLIIECTFVVCYLFIASICVFCISALRLSHFRMSMDWRWRRYLYHGWTFYSYFTARLSHHIWQNHPMGDGADSKLGYSRKAVWYHVPIIKQLLKQPLPNCASSPWNATFVTTLVVWMEIKTTEMIDKSYFKVYVYAKDVGLRTRCNKLGFCS